MSQIKGIEDFYTAKLEIHFPIHEYVEGLIYGIGRRMGEEAVKAEKENSPDFNPAWIDYFNDGQFVAEILRDGFDSAFADADITTEPETEF